VVPQRADHAHLGKRDQEQKKENAVQTQYREKRKTYHQRDHDEKTNNGDY